MNSEFCRSRRVLSTLLYLQNSLYPTQPLSIIANYIAFLVLINVISVHTVKVIFVSSAKQ